MSKPITCHKMKCRQSVDKFHIQMSLKVTSERAAQSYVKGWGLEAITHP